MKVAIVGAGFTGLAAAVELIESGHDVTVYEADKKAGGLAVGFENKDWGWALERYYHHVFTNDAEVISFANKVGCPIFFRRPKTNSFINGKIQQLDSPISLLLFPDLNLVARIRMGLGLLVLKLTANGQFFERYTASEFLPKLVGAEGFTKIWKPLLTAKFGPYVDEVNMAWFWARVYKRTPSLGYFEGGFQNLADKAVEWIRKNGGIVRLGTKIDRIKQKKNDKWLVNESEYDKILLTIPATLTEKLLGKNIAMVPNINYLWSQNMILVMDHSMMSGYWLNILDNDFPFMVMVEHTNFIDKKHYGDRVILYLGNYLPDGDKRLKMDEEKLLRLYLPYLKRINPEFESGWIKKSWCFESPFAQPVFPINYSRHLPAMKTKLKNAYIANMSMVYPWDRGTNYAVQLGKKVVSLMTLSSGEKEGTKDQENDNEGSDDKNI